MSDTTEDTTLSPLAPAAPGSPLADIRRQLIDANREKIKESLARDYVDRAVPNLAIPGAFTVYARFEYPSLSHFNRLQQSINLSDTKAGAAATMSVLKKFLVQQCVGVYMVPEDQPDLFLSADLAIDPDAATNPETWPTFADGYAAIAETFLIDGVTSPYSLIEHVYTTDGQIEGESHAILRAAGYLSAGN